MQHSPSEWQTQTFAEGVLLSPVVFCKPVKEDMEQGPQTPVVSKATGVKKWYAWEVS